MPKLESAQAGLGRYLQAAFLYHWNLLGFLGAAGAAALMAPDLLLPLVGAVELTYLALLVSRPRFRAAIDAAHKQALVGPQAEAVDLAFQQLLAGLGGPARARFDKLKARCLDMRRLAAGVRGRTDDSSSAADSLRSDALDRLLWAFLRLLYSEQALQRFLSSTDPQEIADKLKEQEQRRDNHAAAPDERILRALADSISTLKMRLDNYSKAQRNAELISVELDRIEGKIQALTEIAVSHQDPDFLTQQVDSVADSMSQSEVAMRELQDITGLSEQMAGAPQILDDETER